MLNYSSAKNHGYLLNYTFFRNLFFTKMCIIQAITHNLHTQQIIILVTFHVLTIIDLSRTSILTNQNYSEISAVSVKLCQKKWFLRKISFLEPVYQRHAVRFKPIKSAMHPTFQNTDCFKAKMASITGMLTFSTVNPENFSLIPLYHPENEANF